MKRHTWLGPRGQSIKLVYSSICSLSCDLGVPCAMSPRAVECLAQAGGLGTWAVFHAGEQGAFQAKTLAEAGPC